MMTDDEFERSTNRQVLREARGDVLIGGLGIGLILDPIIAKADSVTVIEINPDVIKLVGPVFPSVKIVEADCYSWKPENTYDVIYFDIWSYFNSDTSRLASGLHRRYRKYLRPGGWIASWCVIANRTHGK